ncbi:uncharacterized protein LDX57_012094 [Aspergillus melleus]|uniref:uncharacterized protein n=1 Tax=Aspergillus melleus TaxID=138277 RepID=UPI001E8E2CC8|nr:uncharacterized protein LDX57_012094 [Aspergillus melleus]KAH8434447.1 hypothetical protein LDX57_012094 [Aspergillus melleus]
MTASSLVSHDDYGVQHLDPWVDTSQYAPTPGNFRWSTASPSDISCINVEPVSPVDYASPRQPASQKNSLPLLQYGDWGEGRTYDEDPPTCIHYLIEWKITLNNRTVAKDTEQDLVLAPRYYWRLFLQPKLKELLLRKYPYRKLESDDTSVVVSATRQKGLTLRFDGTDVDWTSIEKQLLDWGDLFLAGKKLRLVISFNYMENTSSSNVSGRTTDKRGTSSATQRMLQERDRQIYAEEAASGEPPAWKEVYALMRCPGPCELGPHCWQDPYGKKHYKLYRDQLGSLVKYVQNGGILQSHEDVPGTIREQIYRAERQRLDRPRANNRSTAEASYPPINITNVLPTQSPQAPGWSASTFPEDTIASSVEVPAIHIPGLLDVAVREYSSWQQSRLGDEILKAEVRKACDVALDDGLDLAQIDEDKDPNYFKTRGVKWGIARRFVKDIRYWAEKYNGCVTSEADI